MVTADTNVWARAHLNDDVTQAKKARTALENARSAGGVFVPVLVLAELSWVLRARWERERILYAIEIMLQTQGVIIELPATVRKALEASRKGTVGFADHLIAEIGFDAGAREVITFDKAFGRTPNSRWLK